MDSAIATTLAVGITALALGAGDAPQTQSSDSAAKRCERPVE